MSSAMFTARDRGIYERGRQSVIAALATPNEALVEALQRRLNGYAPEDVEHVCEVIANILALSQEGENNDEVG